MLLESDLGPDIHSTRAGVTTLEEACGLLLVLEGYVVPTGTRLVTLLLEKLF